ncbi:Uncharacterised protein [Vibrio cholerae]|nr:Uncharacterised protein [Vibrio cholerae]
MTNPNQSLSPHWRYTDNPNCSRQMELIDWQAVNPRRYRIPNSPIPIPTVQSAMLWPVANH